MRWVRLLPRRAALRVLTQRLARRPAHVAVLVFRGRILSDPPRIARFVAQLAECYAKAPAARVLIAFDIDANAASVAAATLLAAVQPSGIVPLVFGHDGVCGDAVLFRENPGAQAAIAAGTRSRAATVLIPQPFFCTAKAGGFSILPFATIATRADCRLASIVSRPISASPFSLVAMSSRRTNPGDTPDSIYTLY